jgi:hypothetical protein
MNTAIKTLAFAAALLAPAVQAAAGSTVYVPLGNAGEALVIDATRDEVVTRSSTESPACPTFMACPAMRPGNTS